MTTLNEIINNYQSNYNGILYTMKKKVYPPWQPSGNEGRYSGAGTYAFYFGDSIITCWNEIKDCEKTAINEDYNVFSYQVRGGIFVDVGAVEGTRFVQHKNDGGWIPTQELSDYLVEGKILGFRYASRVAIHNGSGGTCFCIYKSVLSLSEKDFVPFNNYMGV